MNNQYRRFSARLFAHRSARWALAVVALLLFAALLGPVIRGIDSNAQLDIVHLKNAPPSWRFPFGTDALSRDLLARVLAGARISLSVGALAALLATTIGAAYGLVAGYLGGRVDAAMMRLLDAMMSIPRVLLLIAVLTIWAGYGQSVPLAGVIVLIGATGWFAVSRLVRAEVMTLRDADFVLAARALGAPTPRILWRHLLPNVAAPIIVSATLAVGNVIALEAGLSFLGIGAPPPAASWGAIFTDGVDPFSGAWWVPLFPGLAIVVTVLAFNVLGDALRDVLDPRQLHLARPLPDPTLAVLSTRRPPENG